MGSFTWDPFCELTAFNPGNGAYGFGYDGFGRRVKQIYGGTSTFYVFDGDLLLGEVQPLGALNAQATFAYTWGATGLVAHRDILGQRTLWYSFGPQGETRYLTNAAGQVTAGFVYTTYGLPITQTGTDSTHFRYGGQFGYYTVDATNLILCSARWYSPTLGHWLSRDPAGYSGGPNLYEYCSSDPVGLNDPSGLDHRNSVPPGYIRPSAYQDREQLAMSARKER